MMVEQGSDSKSDSMLAVSHLAVESHGQHWVGYFSPLLCTNRHRNGPLTVGDSDNQGLFNFVWKSLSKRHEAH